MRTLVGTTTRAASVLAFGALILAPTVRGFAAEDPVQIEVAPTDVLVKAGQTRRFTAYGELGDGSMQLLGARAVSLSVGAEQGCAALSEGTVKCWGGGSVLSVDGVGRLGAAFIPTEVAGLRDVNAVAVGTRYLCAVRQDGTVLCWEPGSATAAPTTPTAIAGISSAVAVATGGYFNESYSCALLAGGSVKCWGRNRFGQLGDGTFTDSTTPVSVQGITTATAITTGSTHACARLASGEVRCWGSDMFGELGAAAADTCHWSGTVYVPCSPTPLTVQGLADATAVAAADLYTCALVSGGGVRCWGTNDWGQLGAPAGDTCDGVPESCSSVPLAVPGISTARTLATGIAACVGLTDGTVKCWGANSYGQVGAETTDLCRFASPCAKSPVTVPGVSGVDTLSASNASCALLTDGRVTCWGMNVDGLLGRWAVSNAPAPLGVPDVANATAVAAGHAHGCARMSDGSGTCWGSNSSGQAGTASSVAGVAAGHSHTCWLLADGHARCEGSHFFGQLGYGANAGDTGLVAGLSGGNVLSGITALAAGAEHTCALLSNGSVACWGRDYGNRPIGIGDVSDARRLTAGAEHTCALLGDGSVKCWGRNSSGQLGNGSRGFTPSPPAPVIDIATATDVAAGDQHTCAALADGTVRCWGSRFYGQMGDGGPLNSVDVATVPETVRGVAGATAVAGGLGHACAVLTSGRVRCWGRNDFGQLGDGSFGNRSSRPVDVVGVTSAQAVAGGGAHTCALLTGGGVLCWGANLQGQLGGQLFFSRDAAEVPWLPRPATIDWTSSDTSVASVDGAGFATAESPGAATITATVGGSSGTGTLRVNHPPVAQGAAVSTSEDENLAITLQADDDEGGPVSFQVAQPPANGSLVNLGAAVCTATACAAGVTYVPNFDFHGSDQFSFRVDDGFGVSSPVVVTIDVAAVNDAPVIGTRKIGVVLDPLDPTAHFATEGGQAFLPGTPLSLFDPNPNDFINFYAIVPEAAFPTDVTVSFQVNASLLIRNAFRLAVSDGETTLLVDAIERNVRGFGLADSTSGESHLVFTPADWSFPTTIRLRRNEAHDGQIVEINGVPLRPPLTVPRYSMTGPLRVTGGFTPVPSIEFGTGYFSVVNVSVDSLQSEHVLPISDRSVREGETLELSVDANDVDGGALSYSASGLPAGAVLDPVSGRLVYTPGSDVSSTSANAVFDVTFVVTDGGGMADSQTVKITVLDVHDEPPSVDAGSAAGGPEGIPIVLDGTVSDPDGGALTTTWSFVAGANVDAGASCAFADASAADTTFTCNDDGTYTLILTAGDGVNPPVTDIVAVSIVNGAPSLGALAAPVDPVPVGAPVTASAVVVDLGGNDTHVCTIGWGDGAVTTSAGTCTGTHAYTGPGVYTLTFGVQDDDGGSDAKSFQYVVVYDPSGGFVTGGGWIDSRAGAYLPDGRLTGKATFGFVSKYKAAAAIPTGETEFHFKMGNLKLQSSGYDWLVISGAQAQFIGSGTINGGGEYRFSLTAIDGRVAGGGGVDKLRMEIWNAATGEVVYDNQPGADDGEEPSAALGGGSIVIHH